MLSSLAEGASPSPPAPGQADAGAAPWLLLTLFTEARAVPPGRSARSSRPALARRRLRRTALASLAALLAMPWAPAALAQDSVATLRAAARVQREFESTRRARLPVDRFLGGSCDFRARRFCFWYDPTPRADDWAEAPAVIAARQRLLEHLDGAAMRIPGDDWIAGQRVRYRIDGGDTTGADGVAQDCRAARWWCAALAGLTAHVQGRFTAADSAFHLALDSMPATRRCDWTDLSRFLPDIRHPPERCEPGAAPDTIAARFWRLARPLLMIPGNDARTEHYARHTMAQLEQHARGAYGTTWGPDTEELLLRFGWPAWWTRRPAASAAAGGAYEVVGHEPVPSWYFHPRARLLASDTTRPVAADWRLHMAAPPARYAPRYARSMHALDAQVQLFRRGDDVLTVASFDATGDTALAGAGGTAALVLERSRHAPLHVATRTVAAPAASWTVRLPWRPVLAAIEMLTAGGDAARVRLPIAPPSAADSAVSGLLFLRDTPAEHARAEDAADLALPHEHVVHGEPLTVFWEMYDWAAAGTPVSLSLSVERTGAGWLARATSRLRLSRAATPIQVRWREVPAARDGIAPRAVRIDLGSQDPGRYRMVLRLDGAGGRRAVRERLVDVVLR